MADPFGFYRDRVSSRIINAENLTFVEVISGERADTLVIPPIGGGVIQYGETPQTGTSSTFFADDATADLGEFEKLNTDRTGGDFTEHSCQIGAGSFCVLEEHVTTAGALDGDKITTASTMDWSIEAKKNSGSEDVVIEMKIKKRDSGGGETTLDTVETDNLTTSYVRYTGTWSVSSDVEFNSTDRLKIEFRTHNKGIPP